MTMVLMLAPVGVAALVLGYVRWAGPGPRSTDGGWTLAPDGLRVVGSMVLLLGAMGVVWVGIGDHQPRLVLTGRVPFDWAAAAAVGVLSGLVGAALLAADRRSRRRDRSTGP